MSVDLSDPVTNARAMRSDIQDTKCKFVAIKLIHDCIIEFGICEVTSTTIFIISVVMVI